MAGASPVAAIDEAILKLDAILSKHFQGIKPEGATAATAAASGAAATAAASGAAATAAKTVEAGRASSQEPALAVTSATAAERAEPAPEAAGLSAEDLDNFSKCLLKVGQVLSVAAHPTAEKLYVCQVATSDGETRQVVAGLRRFVSEEELKGGKVCLVCNLKPAKLAGERSEAMILAGSRSEGEVELVKLLEPPSEAPVGDQVFLQGHAVSSATVKQLSSKVWEKVSKLLQVRGGEATFAGVPLMTTGGALRVALADGSTIR